MTLFLKTQWTSVSWSVNFTNRDLYRKLHKQMCCFVPKKTTHKHVTLPFCTSYSLLNVHVVCIYLLCAKQNKKKRNNKYTLNLYVMCIKLRFLPLHWKLAHISYTKLSPKQWLPFFEGRGESQARSRRWSPIPHELVQVPHGFHTPQPPWTKGKTYN